MRRALLAVLAVVLTLPGCGRTGPPEPREKCVSWHKKREQVWVPMSPGGFFRWHKVRVCDRWVQVPA